MKSTFLFSVSIPIYNTDMYLREAIDSLLDQTIGFEEHIQLILVNDGSTDDSGKICREYAERYPQNIVYIDLPENHGVSNAYYIGIEYAQGKYMCFLGSDDKWTSDAFEKVAAFWEKYDEEIDIVACRVRLFGEKTGYFKSVDHIFTSERICDITQENDAVLHSIATNIFRTEIVKNIRFKYALRSGEDSKIINTILLDRMKYGVLPSVEYLYRSRADGSSITQSRWQYKDFYMYTMEHFPFYFVQLSRERFGTVIPYVQHLLAHIVGIRLKHPVEENVLSESEMMQYREMISSLLQEIDDRIILDARTMFMEHKLFALQLKHQGFRDDLVFEDSKLYYNGTMVYSMQRSDIVLIRAIEAHGNSLFLYGQFCFPFPEETDRFLLVREDGSEVSYCFDESDLVVESLDAPIYRKKGFSFILPVSGEKEHLRAYMNFRGERIALEIGMRAKGKKKTEEGEIYYKKGSFCLFPGKEALLVLKSD